MILPCLFTIPGAFSMQWFFSSQFTSISLFLPISKRHFSSKSHQFHYFCKGLPTMQVFPWGPTNFPQCVERLIWCITASPSSFTCAMNEIFYLKVKVSRLLFWVISQPSTRLLKMHIMHNMIRLHLKRSPCIRNLMAINVLFRRRENVVSADLSLLQFWTSENRGQICSDQNATHPKCDRRKYRCQIT